SQRWVSNRVSHDHGVLNFGDALEPDLPLSFSSTWSLSPASIEGGGRQKERTATADGHPRADQSATGCVRLRRSNCRLLDLTIHSTSSSATVLRNLPMPSASTSTTSPG